MGILADAREIEVSFNWRFGGRIDEPYLFQVDAEISDGLFHEAGGDFCH